MIAEAQRAIDWAALRAPFDPRDIEWRIGQAGEKEDGKPWAKVLAYLTARAVQDRLDAVVGPENWRNEFAPLPFSGGDSQGCLCGISIKIEGEWVTKWDGADTTDFEAIKGGLSSAEKRAAVQWGIGRYLYDLGDSWAKIHAKGRHYANVRAKVSGHEKWLTFRWDEPDLPAWALPPAKDGERPVGTTSSVGAPSRSAASDESRPNGQRKARDTRTPQGAYVACLTKMTLINDQASLNTLEQAIIADARFNENDYRGRLLDALEERRRQVAQNHATQSYGQ